MNHYENLSKNQKKKKKECFNNPLEISYRKLKSQDKLIIFASKARVIPRWLDFKILIIILKFVK